MEDTLFLLIPPPSAGRLDPRVLAPRIRGTQVGVARNSQLTADPFSATCVVGAAPLLQVVSVGIRRSGGDFGLRRLRTTKEAAAAAAAGAGMALLGLLQAGGSVLGQAMEKVTGGNLLSMFLIACAFTLSLVYLLRLAAGHLAPLPAGAVRAPPGVWEGGAATQGRKGLVGAATCARLGVGGGRSGRRAPGGVRCEGDAGVAACPGLAGLGADGPDTDGGHVSGPGRGRACRVCDRSDSVLVAVLVAPMAESAWKAEAVAGALSALVAVLATIGVFRVWWGDPDGDAALGAVALVAVILKSPPYIFSPIPFLGHAIAFGKSPIEFLENAYEKYGPVFSFTMVGKTFTYLLGSDAAALLFNSKNEDLNAEDVYSRLTTPVFGKGVAYDVPNPVFLEQKKMLKSGLNIAHFRQHVSIIENETKEYFQSWGESGEKNLFEALSELIILTASHCLHGKEIRSQLNEKVAQLYADLDGGFSHAAWLLPGWLPLPSFRRRDRAHREIKSIFYKAIQKRRQSEEKIDDILQTLLDSTYKDGRPLTDDEVAGMLIGLLLAGQHTSSTTSAWMGFFLARDKTLQEKCYLEQKAVCGENLPPLTYDQLKDLNLLDRCIKETLRLRPPIMTMMRMAKTPQIVAGYTIPPGHQVCVSPTVNQRLKDSWNDRLHFNPDRYLQDNPASGEKFAYVPFGAGRHRCIGENFAYVQIKTIWSTMLRLYEFDLIDGYFPTVNYTTMIHTPENPVIRYKRRSK
ncbi:hypothetical protein QTO34_004485 [Cnephaeus nilssonii]|uniref:Lanosterol 14-alpha demethylase n=1 Tax=Cnephaeus nilssonii TaxID=3371016 RepID=A0AA40HPE5_CNENI|nr:hypothetical protein QTO34_004485 [Eptesicus nilssonii]